MAQPQLHTTTRQESKTLLIGWQEEIAWPSASEIFLSCCGSERFFIPCGGQWACARECAFARGCSNH